MPTIPTEGAYTESELRFVENQPPGLWPENQDSIFGQLRRVLTDQIQFNRSVIDSLAQELFVPTAKTYLSLWEEMLGAAISPAGKSVSQRQAILLARLRYGTFTRTQRNDIIAQFIQTTFGQPAAFTLLGIPFTAGGIPLYGPLADASTLFRVYENPTTFSYEVFIKNTNTPDIGALTRELARVTPAHLSFTIDNTLANILNYVKMMRDSAPNAYWKLGAAFTDSSGNALDLTNSGSPASVAAIALNTDSNASDFTASPYLFRADNGLLKPTASMTLEAWINSDNVTSRRGIFDKGQYFLQINATGKVQFTLSLNGGVFTDLISNAGLSTATTYHIVATFDGLTMKLYINGVLDKSLTITGGGSIDQTSNQFEIGRVGVGNLFDGRIDEAAIYSYPMSAARVLAHYKTGTNVP
jgi:hypothetical protein